jgi:hypothetical protein
MLNESSQRGPTGESDNRGQLGQLMHRRLKALAVLGRGETGTRNRSEIGKARIPATTLGQRARIRLADHHETDYIRERQLGRVTFRKREARPANELEQTSPIASDSVGRDFEGALRDPLRKAKSSPGQAKSGQTIDGNARSANRVREYHAAGIVGTSVHAKLADAIAAGGGSQSVGRKRITADVQSASANLDGRNLDSNIRARTGVLRSRKAAALTAAGTQWATDRIWSEHSTVGEFGRAPSVSPLRDLSSRRRTSEESESEHWNEHNNAPRSFSSVGRNFEARRQTKSVGRGSYGERGLATSTRHTQGRPERQQSALTINFSPSIVLESAPDQERKRNIVDALSRHSHELVLLIESEIAKQRRVEF